MGNLKEIRRRITSVKNTKQITRAMKLVSAAKLRRAQDAATNGRRYAEEIRNALADLLALLPEQDRPALMRSKDSITNRRIVVVGGERGLCGPYNANIAKSIEKQLLESKGVSQELLAIGSKVVSSAKRFKWNVESKFEKLPENAAEWPIQEMVAKLVDDFVSGKCDEVVIFYTKFITAMSQEVVKIPLLPLRCEELKSIKQSKDSISPKTDPSVKILLEGLIPLYLETQFRQSALESKASDCN